MVENTPKKKNIRRKPLEEIDLLDMMLTSLVDLLEKKGVITQKEWESEIKRKLRPA